MVFVAALTARTAVPAATLTTAGVCPQPEVRAALEVAVLITSTVPASGSAAYRVWVASSTVPTLASGCPIGISATGTQPARFPAWQVAPLSTSIRGRLLLLA